MKKIIICSALVLAACSHEETALKNLDAVVEQSPKHADLQNMNHANSDSESKAYFIHVKVLSKDQKNDTADNTGGVVYFHETKELDPRKSFLKHWDHDPDFIVDFEKMTAISKSKNLSFYIQDQVDDISSEEAWLYRESE